LLIIPTNFAQLSDQRTTPITWQVNQDNQVCNDVVIFCSIQKAINDVLPGDTISIASGSYSDLVIVNKTVSLIGENKSKTFIEDGIELNTENGNLADVQIKNLYLTGETPRSHPWQQTIGGGNNPSGLIQNLVIDDNVFDSTRNFDPNLVAPGSNTGNPTTGVGSAVFLFQGDGTFTFTRTNPLKILRTEEELRCETGLKNHLKNYSKLSKNNTGIFLSGLTVSN